MCSLGDLLGPTAWTNRGYFWRGFVRLDSTANPERKEEGSLTPCLRSDRHPWFHPHPLGGGGGGSGDWKTTGY